MRSVIWQFYGECPHVSNAGCLTLMLFMWLHLNLCACSGVCSSSTLLRTEKQVFSSSRSGCAWCWNVYIFLFLRREPSQGSLNPCAVELKCCQLRTRIHNLKQHRNDFQIKVLFLFATNVWHHVSGRINVRLSNSAFIIVLPKLNRSAIKLLVMQWDHVNDSQPHNIIKFHSFNKVVQH